MKRNSGSSETKITHQTVVAVILSWYEPRMLKGIATYAKEHDWSLLLDSAQEHGWTALPAGLNGILCMVGPESKWINYLQKTEVPRVGICFTDEGKLTDCPRVLQDDYTCGVLAAEHLLSLGFTSFLGVGKQNRTFFRERLRGFSDTCQKHGYNSRLVNIGEQLTHRQLRQPVEKALREIKFPAAAFAPSDVTCVHVLNCAMDIGIRVPEELALLGANNEELICDYAPVPLSSVRLNFTQLGYESAALLHQIIDGREPLTEFPPIAPLQVVVRQSSNILAVPDIRVANALQFLWHNLEKPIGPQEVSSHIGVPANTLMRLFRKHLHTSIGEELKRVRLERAKKLLTIGNHQVQDVASMCGFTTPNYFNNVFKQAFGLTPKKFTLSASHPPSTPNRTQGGFALRSGDNTQAHTGCIQENLKSVR